MAGSEAEPLWQRFPVAAQRLRAALLDATFPHTVEADATLSPAGEDAWQVHVALAASGARYDETFSGAELRAYRGRWNDWTDELATRVAAEQR